MEESNLKAKNPLYQGLRRGIDELFQNGADDRNRTCTGLPPDPKSGASANSATSAHDLNNINIQLNKSQ